MIAFLPGEENVATKTTDAISKEQFEPEIDEEEEEDEEDDALLGNDRFKNSGVAEVHLQTSVKEGLTEQEAKNRLKSFGFNELKEERVNYFLVFSRYFTSPLELALLAAAALAGGLEEWIDFGVIFALLLMNAGVGFFQEYQAGSLIGSLKQTLVATQSVLRNGHEVEVEARELVPGDIIRLDEGDVAPADARLVAVDTVLQVDQSTITGESMAVTKRGSEKDVIYASSTVKRGRGLAMVVATGASTFVGKAAMLAVNAPPNAGFVTTLHTLGRFLIICDFMAILLVAGAGYFRGTNFVNLLREFLILTIVSIPVALPAVITTTMAVGARRLAEHKAIVSRLTAIETLSEVDILCSDKTGTLTLNKLTVHDPVALTGQREQTLMICAVLACNLRRKGREPIDRAIVKAIQNYPEGAKEVPKYRILDFEPFDPVSKRATATAIHSETQMWIQASKGSVHQIEDLAEASGTLSPEIKAEYNNTIDAFARRGFRSLGVAVRYGQDGKWQLLGVLPLFDPPRHDSSKTIAEAKKLGITVKMLTGDQLAIAKETGSRLGLGPHMFDMRKLEVQMMSMQGEEYGDLVEGADGFAGVFPEDKFNIVQLLQGRKHVVAMTGDGVNDAPALKKSDVGIAVKGATDAARSASDIIFLNSGLGVMINAIKMARSTFHRMNAYALYRIALSFHLLIYLAFSIIVMQFDLNATLVVFLAIFSDVSSLAIAFDKAPYSMDPVRWKLRQMMTMSLAYAVLLVAGTFVIHGSVLRSHWATPQMTVFLEVALTQGWLIFSARTHAPFWTSMPSPILIVIVLIIDILASIFACHGWFVDEEPISVVDCIRIWIFSAGIFLLCDIAKCALASVIFDKISYGSNDKELERKKIAVSENKTIKLKQVATQHSYQAGRH